MRKLNVIMLTIFALFPLRAQSQGAAPLKLVQTIRMPGVKGHFDHFGVDLKGHRLFATPEDHKTVEVFDLRTGKPIYSIGGIGKPHAVLYPPETDQIFVTDGVDGAVKIFNGKTYALVKTVKLLLDADSIGYDPASKYLYVDNGGKDAGMESSLISIIDTNSGEHVGDIKVEGNTLEAMALEKSSPRFFVNIRDKNQVAVVDREKRAVLAIWPVSGGQVNVAMALDEANHRLFVACRSGHIVVFDSETGKEMSTLPIAKGVDDLVYDPGRKRLYAACDGVVDVFEQRDPDHYQSLGKIATGPVGKTARLVPELNRYFVAVPQHDNTDAEILVYQVQ